MPVPGSGSTAPSRRDVLKAAAATPLLSQLTAGAQDGPAERAPNVVILISDDQGRELGPYGRKAVRTPHLDALAAAGCRYDNAYTPVAVCVPSRAALYTGRYPTESGATGFTPISKSTRPWTEYMAEAGAYTGMIGKLAVKPAPRFKFDFRRKNGANGAKHAGQDWWTKQLAEFLEERDQSRPFCLTVGFNDPHRPFPHDGDKSGWDSSKETPTDPRAVEIPKFVLDCPDVRRDYAAFYDAIHRLDRTVGAMLALLEESGLAENTLVIFTSDNGVPFPYAKTTLYEAGINMPLIARWPGVIEPGSSSAAFISFVDILPTCLSLVGAEIPAELSGQSLLPLFRGEPGFERDAIFGSHTDHLVLPSVPARSVRIGNWKYIQNLRNELRFDNNDLQRSIAWIRMRERAATDEAIAQRVHKLQYRPKHELYDLEHDPHEFANLADAEQHAPTLRKLQARLLEFMRATGDPLIDEWKS